MVQAMDAVTSFAHLTTNLPEWILQVDQLSTHTTQKHAEFAAEYTRVLNGAARPKRVKSPSVTSIHSTNDKPVENGTRPATAEDTSSQVPDFPGISPFEAGNRFLYAQARRKRKPASSVRSGASGPQKFRSKQSVIIYYDSFLQEQLDTMVKNIASARNNVRRGKMSRSVQKGLQLPIFNRRISDMYNSSTEDLNSLQILSTKGLPMDAKIALAQAKPQADEVCFFRVDKELEQAHALCETAAHQFLRDGDCKIELDGVKARFEAALALATETLPKLKAEKEAGEDQGEAHTDSDATLYEKPSQELISAKLAPSLDHSIRSPMPNVAGAGTTEIEVDDDDGSSMEVDMAKFRSARAAGARMGLRSGD